jgi:hypothetical protein
MAGSASPDAGRDRGDPGSEPESQAALHVGTSSGLSVREDTFCSP